MAVGIAGLMESVGQSLRVNDRSQWTGAIGETLDRHAERVEHRHVKIRQRRIFTEHVMAAHDQAAATVAAQ